MYILFEGIDRVGKSTQIERVSTFFDEVIVTKEPGGTKLGQQIRSLILHENPPSSLAELFLFLADRAEHFAKVIIPNRNKLILSDRGYISGMAYALSKNILDEKKLFELNHIAMQGEYPDKIILFEISEEELLRRIDRFTKDNIEQRGVAYLLQVQKIMKKLVISSKIPYLLINASDEMDIITKTIVSFIKDSNGN
ncbi:dTMP kinase [Nitratiruptor sp. YY09-18]|uniref:dTMP kinase n=1 Tax=Nitratiruptor sp. YY09-18 TaxID=2724901 RepID=UPI0019150FFD|nr:dTMP kinase [Nitratiruptor sp. YY09-18]BCD68039.1 dTMP kinase [Nitratiruptor sp. YY09-18]